ncbi:hypothetical protein GCM10027598_46930 [Amycolatopsis oliviviridis]|uniref:Mersacidin/lichenicidin family type 2 lantibiotic n=1 Tax=Amycolatopsis oliviviridis TaxID=1471590 RepID=A0ABQ3MEI0_9PSEU|nr:mersacidin/lichenicidin family type 2 lantibiotic [Amycolatopsis oliviviridis]GHH38568.1 hypothetical protein GCM10017790_84540 [Amycolatopsis oliviviridis]
MDLVRAWKDPDYRSFVREFPENPAGQSALAQIDIAEAGVLGAGSETTLTAGCCNPLKTVTTVVSPWCSVSLAVC